MSPLFYKIWRNKPVNSYQKRIKSEQKVSQKHGYFYTVRDAFLHGSAACFSANAIQKQIQRQRQRQKQKQKYLSYCVAG